MAIPFFVMMGIFSIAILLTQEMESEADRPMLIGFSVLAFAAAGYVPYISRKQLNSKKSYMNLMDVPILTLTETHLLYKFDELEQYYIPWNQVTKIEMNSISERFENVLRYISVSVSEEMRGYIHEVRRESYLKDQTGDIVMFSMYFEEPLKDVYRIMTDFLNKAEKK